MLDLAKVSQQISRMAAEQQLVAEDGLKRLDKALGQLALESGRLPAFIRKLQASKTSWLVAGIRESLEKTYRLPPRPLAITVVATDGSQIAPSHHEVIPAFLLNISTVVLHYGTGERAELTSTPTLFYRDDDLYTDYGGQRVHVTGDLLGMRRTLMECQALLRQATRAQATGHRTCALSDGSLILWQLEGKPQDYKQTSLECYLGSLEQARQQQIPVAGYISRPRSRDVLNALRVGLCPETVAYCDRCPYMDLPRLPCAEIEGLSDRRLFENLLQPGERTAVFDSHSRILDDYGVHRIVFFYLHVGTEVVRIEVPQWVATSATLLNLVHAVAYDQAQKGMGYPVALAEAHQHAVVRGAERDLFYEMVTAVLLRRGVRATISPKNLGKRRMTV
ncbi:MAG: DNA double-strand break repair nuclease NurA [Candidatus Tectomicrobia bacterium]|uniref:DNA double-strand break repair nuclease NurA n=1 Tax=Tectimicrobiota bacterium TaxID=2528274 RepID=A0A937VZT2_UNCTE|nr:DNA double-strand break repair nuclease NurA [Candidatus Tectomicrobia bacterium]